MTQFFCNHSEKFQAIPSICLINLTIMKRCQIFPYWSGQQENFQNLSQGEAKRFPRHLQWVFMVMNCFKNASLDKTFQTLDFINNRGGGEGLRLLWRMNRHLTGKTLKRFMWSFLTYGGVPPSSCPPQWKNLTLEPPASGFKLKLK